MTGTKYSRFVGSVSTVCRWVKVYLTRTTIPSFAYGGVFLCVSVFSLAVAFVPWGVIPFPSVYSNLNLGILFVLAASSISVYSVMVSGWVSNSKYSVDLVVKRLFRKSGHTCSMVDLVA